MKKSTLSIAFSANQERLCILGILHFHGALDLLLDLNLMILACDFLGKEDQDEIMEKIENKWKKMSSGPDMTKKARLTCDKQFNWRSGLKSHRERKHNKQLLACGQCDFKISKPRSLAMHIKSKHKNSSSNSMGNINITGINPSVLFFLQMGDFLF